ncbi:MAG: YGGT family protein [candidate division WS6 bacterium OLB20]|uniref:YGGT family protein n=1 Tax=candidate division WS6 bacterium OLB20 TaxID=1617426 RepID=A0A136LXS7_9BACT|nr:MAG: YGGT family protein [candidate division WS6 bacterium OLB20]
MRAQLRAVVFGIFGIALAIVVVRILLVLVGANRDSQFVIFWFDMSNMFVGAFRDIYPQLQAQLLTVRIELFSIFAMVFYLVVALLTQKSVSSFTEDSRLDVVKSIIDSLFKFLEFFLIARFLLKLTAASIESDFVRFVYGISAVVYEPFKDILPAVRIADFGIIFESSTLIAIIVIIIFDLVTEGIIDSIAGVPKRPKQQPAPQYQQAAQPSININLPPQQPQVIDQRQVHFSQPQQPYPGYQANHLEGQRPPQYLPPQQGQYPQGHQPTFGQNAPRNNNAGGGFSA